MFYIKEKALALDLNQDPTLKSGPVHLSLSLSLSGKKKCFLDKQDKQAIFWPF